MTQLLDKIIDVEFLDGNGKAIGKIISPRGAGMKPQISLKGALNPGNMVNDIELRVTNLYLGDTELTALKFARITAGYSDTAQQAIIQGQIWVSYQESPSPDGVTYFKIMIGQYSSFIETAVDISLSDTEFVSGVIKALAEAMGLEVDTGNLEATPLAAPFIYSGPASGAVAKLKSEYSGVGVYMDSIKLTAYTMGAKSGKVKYEINFFSSPPKKEPYGWTFTAPWLPDLRPGDLITIDAKYFKQSFAAQGTQVASGFTKAPLQILSIDFDFITVGRNNNMSVLALSTAEGQQW